MTEFEQIFLQNWDIKISGKNDQISLQEYLKRVKNVKGSGKIAKLDHKCMACEQPGKKLDNFQE